MEILAKKVDMIQKPNSLLKLTCDLGNYVKVTHMQFHPSRYTNYKTIIKCNLEVEAE